MPGGQKKGHLITLEQIKRAVEVQLDPDQPPSERRRQLIGVLHKIRYYQRRNEEARYYHDRTRRKRLKRAGIDLRKVNRCPATLPELAL